MDRETISPGQHGICILLGLQLAKFIQRRKKNLYYSLCCIILHHLINLISGYFILESFFFLLYRSMLKFPQARD